jgi:hypothetical protein
LLRNGLTAGAAAGVQLLLGCGWWPKSVGDWNPRLKMDLVAFDADNVVSFDSIFEPPVRRRSTPLDLRPPVPTYSELVAAARAGSESAEKLVDPIRVDVKAVTQRIVDIRERLAILQPAITETAALLTKIEASRKSYHDGYSDMIRFVREWKDRAGAEELEKQMVGSICQMNGAVGELVATKTQELTKYQEEQAALLTTLEALRELAATVPVAGGAVPNACVICAERTVNRVLDVCGHTACDQCLTNVKDRKCFLCRKVFIRAIPMFL